MNSKMEDNIYACLDIGTAKIACIVSRLDSYGKLNILGVGESPALGIKKGAVVNVDKTANSIQKAVEEAELMAGIDIDAVWVGIAGDHIRSINGKGVVGISSKDHEITEFDISRALDSAKAISISRDRQILHVIPQEFIIDDQAGIKEPVGMRGTRLEILVHICTGALTCIQNIYRSVERAGFNIVDLVFEPLATSYAVLGKDEMELGVALIDMGGEITNLSIYFEESIRHTAVFGLGGRNITGDIARSIQLPIDKAEELKKQYGSASLKLVKKDEYVGLPRVGGRENREVSRLQIVSVIKPRVVEIFSKALEEIKQTEYADKLVGGVVLTGGGALMQGLPDIAEEVFKMPVRIGVPSGFGGLTEMAKSPVHATGVGLCMYAVEHKKNKNNFSIDYSFTKMIDRVKSWVKEIF